MKEAVKARLAESGAASAEILFPNENCDLTKFAVVACDQYTAEPEYWQRVKDFVGDAPSALNMILPEAWLKNGERHATAINPTMERYLADGTLRSLGEGMVFLHRETGTGVRRGLLLALDLEQYDFAPGSRSLIRATEKTIVERLPARIAIRREAPLEIPHIMVLLDDRENRLMSMLDAAFSDKKPLYDFQLMENSGRLRGWFFGDDDTLMQVGDVLADLRQNAVDGMLYAMGDGNHSFAAAKAHWDALRPTLSADEQRTHPARYALAEIVNLYDPALAFEPIHRLLLGVDPAAVQRELDFDAACPPPLQQLQPKLDEWLSRHGEATLEYIHGREDCLRLAADAPDRLAIVWDSFPKDTLFADVAANGVLCRKSFSMGAAPDKRFYLESRRIK